MLRRASQSVFTVARRFAHSKVPTPVRAVHNSPHLPIAQASACDSSRLPPPPRLFVTGFSSAAPRSPPGLNQHRTFSSITAELSVTVPPQFEHEEEEYKRAWKMIEQEAYSFSKLDARFRSDFNLAMLAVSKGGGLLEHASPELRANKLLVLKSLEKSAYPLRFADDSLLNDFDVMLKAVSHDGNELRFAPSHFQDNEELASMAVRNGLNFLTVSKRLQNDKGFALKAVAANGLFLESLSKRLRGDSDVVQRAVAKNPEALQYASFGQKNNPETVLTAVSGNVSALRHASVFLRGDLGFMIKAVKQTCLALRYANPVLKDCRELVLLAVGKDGRMIGDASSRLRNDEKVVIEAMKNGGDIFSVSERLRAKRDIALLAVTGNGMNLKGLPEYKKDIEIVKAALKDTSWAYQLMDKSLQKNRDVAKWAISHHHEAISQVPSEFRDDEELVALAVEGGFGNFMYASERIQSTPEVARKFIDQNFFVIQFVNRNILSEEFILAAFARSKLTLKEAINGFDIYGTPGEVYWVQEVLRREGLRRGELAL